MNDNFELQIDKMCDNARILIVDDSPSFIEVYGAMLEGIGTCRSAKTAKDALELMSTYDFDIALFDHYLPDGTGLALCNMVRKVRSARELPILIITASEDESLEGKCWKVGCSDFIKKPVQTETLKHRLLSQLRLKFSVDLLRNMSSQDQLTGLFNRRHLDEIIEKQKKTNSSELSVLLLDIDYFKKFNDEYGHHAGDQCLKQIGTILKNAVREPDRVSVRYGGEEFLVVLPNTTRNDAQIVAERIRSDIESANIEHSQSPYKKVTASVGIACGDSEELNWKTLFKAADESLYKAKAAGRNTVSIGD